MNSEKFLFFFWLERAFELKLGFTFLGESERCVGEVGNEAKESFTETAKTPGWCSEFTPFRFMLGPHFKFTRASLKLFNTTSVQLRQ